MEFFIFFLIMGGFVTYLFLDSKRIFGPSEAPRQTIENNSRWTNGPELLPSKRADESIENFKARRRKLAIEWAKQVLQNKEKYLILDTETTGLGKSDVIIQLALMDLDGNAIINTYIQPSKGKRISAEASAIHGITAKNLKDAPRLIDVADEIAAAVSNKIVIVYNAEFDSEMLYQTMLRDDFTKFLKIRMNCAMKHYSAFVGEYSEYYGDFKFQRLTGGDHSALGDCLATLKVIQKMASSEEQALPEGKQ